MEMPARSEEQIASAHAHRIAIDDSPDAFAFNDKAECVLRVAVFRGGLARSKVLNCGPERGRYISITAQTRIGEADCPSLAAATDWYEFARLLRERQEF